MNPPKKTLLNRYFLHGHQSKFNSRHDHVFDHVTPSKGSFVIQSNLIYTKLLFGTTHKSTYASP